MFDAKSQEIADLRNVIQAACIGGTPLMIERWKQLFPDAPVPTVYASPAPSLSAAPAGDAVLREALTRCLAILDRLYNDLLMVDAMPANGLIETRKIARAALSAAPSSGGVEALRALVEQIEKCDPVDECGHHFTMNKAYLDAKELL
jgi:hypothetical protein